MPYFVSLAGHCLKYKLLTCHIFFNLGSTCFDALNCLIDSRAIRLRLGPRPRHHWQLTMLPTNSKANTWGYAPDPAGGANLTGSPQTSQFCSNVQGSRINTERIVDAIQLALQKKP